MRHSVNRLNLLSVFGLFLFWSAWLEAETFVLQDLSGSASINYGYVTAEGSASESTGVSASANAAGYFWQPWFATSAFGLTVGLTRSATEGGSENSTWALSGRIGLEVFPRSRYPFSFSLNRSDSQLDYVNNLNVTSSNKFVNTRIFMRQSYIGRRSLLADISWVHNQNESRFDDSKSDSLNASLRVKRESHFFHASSSYATNKSATSNIQPQNLLLAANHDYVPGTELSVSTTGSYINNQTKTIGATISSEVSQAGSFFSWRPEHKPFTFSGGARLSSATSSSGGDQESNDFSVNSGMDYRFTTRLKLLANLAAGATDTDSIQSVRSSGALSLSYNSDQYLFGGFNYSWNVVGSGSSSNSETDGVREKTQALSLALGQRAMRSWSLSRSSSLNTSFSMTGSYNDDLDSEKENTTTIALGANTGMNFRGRRGTTFLSVSGSSSVSSGETDSAFSMLNGVVSRNQVINRLSSMSGNVTVQTTAQQLDGGDITTTKSAFATGNYLHGRVFGVYALKFSSGLSYQKSFDDETDSKDTLDWQNRFEYRVGLLDTALLVRMLKTSGTDPTTSVNFRATRTF